MEMILASLLVTKYKNFRSLCLVILLSLCLTAVPSPAFTGLPITGSPAALPISSAILPSLDAFIGQVRTGLAGQVSGLYIDDVFAYPVVQQPSGQPAFVSPSDGKLTQFGLASSYDSLGFLAHNTLAGASFSAIQQGQLITVVFGDGHTTIYQVSWIRRYQATRPFSPYSAFIDQSTGQSLTASALFFETYGIKDRLILQTCISAKGVESWGRLFIIAVPYFPEPANVY